MSIEFFRRDKNRGGTESTVQVGYKNSAELINISNNTDQVRQDTNTFSQTLIVLLALIIIIFLIIFKCVKKKLKKIFEYYQIPGYY